MKKLTVLALILTLALSACSGKGNDDNGLNTESSAPDATISDPSAAVTPVSDVFPYQYDMDFVYVDPASPETAAPEGYYTLVSFVENGKDAFSSLKEMAEEAGISIDDAFHINFIKGGEVIMAVAAFDAGDEYVHKGAYSLNGDTITFTFDIDGESKSFNGILQGGKITIDIEGSSMVFKKNDKYQGRGDLDTLYTGTVIPASGGAIRASGNTELTFTPDRTGLWEFSLSGYGNADPKIWLSDSVQYLDLYYDKTGDDPDARMVAPLEAGVTYTITGKDENVIRFDYTLTLKLREDLSLPEEGGNMDIRLDFSINVSQSRLFTFTPKQSGIWRFRASHGGETSLRLTIYTSGRFTRDIGSDYAGGGDDDAFVYVYLEAGSAYLIQIRYLNERGETDVSTLSEEHTNAEYPAGAKWMACDGGDILIWNNDSTIAFVPNKSGTWLFYTFGIDWFPLLEITDMSGKRITPDGGGNGDLSELLTVKLTAGTVYLISTGVNVDDIESYYSLRANYNK